MPRSPTSTRSAWPATPPTVRAAAPPTRSCRPAPEYLVKQLAEFKSGKRANAIMKGMVAALSDDDMKNVAAFYASKPPSPASAEDKATWSCWARRSTAAASPTGCPGLRRLPQPQRRRHPAQYPRLGGQHADYTEAQLVAFRSGARANNAQMTGIAAKMSDARSRPSATTSPGCAEPPHRPEKPVPHRLFLYEWAAL
jgi:cytochrome c553